MCAWALWELALEVQGSGTRPSIGQAVFQKQKALFLNQTHSRRTCPRRSYILTLLLVFWFVLLNLSPTHLRPRPRCIFKTFWDNFSTDFPDVEVWKDLVFSQQDFRRLWATSSSEKCLCPWEGVWNDMFFKVFSKPFCDSVILCLTLGFVFALFPSVSFCIKHLISLKRIIILGICVLRSAECFSLLSFG